MYKFFKVVDGAKLYCNDKGELTKDENGENVSVPETDETAVDVDSGVDEASKMLSDAMVKAQQRGDEEAQNRIKEAQTNIDAFFEAAGKSAQKHKPEVPVTEYKASFDVDKLKAQMEPLQKGSKGSASFTIRNMKDLDVLSKNTSREDLTGDVIQPDRDNEIVREPQRSPFMEEIADTVSTNSDTVEWVEVVGETGAPATTAELATIPQKDYEFQTFRQPVEKIAVINKHSVELLKYGPELVAAIRRMLNVDMRLETDRQLLAGNGTAPNLQGVLGVASTLDVGDQRVANANLFDVLRIAGTKIANAGKGAFNPNFVILHPDDTERFDLTKNADGDYIMPPFYDAQGRRVRGARIIENTGIEAGKFLLGDFNYMHVRPNGGMEVELTNTDGEDFQNDILSIKMRRFLAAYVKNNENGAFIQGDIDSAISTLTSA